MTRFTPLAMDKSIYFFHYSAISKFWLGLFQQHLRSQFFKLTEIFIILKVFLNNFDWVYTAGWQLTNNSENIDIKWDIRIFIFFEKFSIWPVLLQFPYFLRFCKIIFRLCLLYSCDSKFKDKELIFNYLKTFLHVI